MTAPDLQSLIAGVLAEHWTFTTHGDFDALLDRCDGCHADIYTHGHATDQKTAWAAHQARAVLAALTEAGTVEWGVQLGDHTPSFLQSEYDARMSYTIQDGRKLVSRLTLPWTAVTE